MKYTIIDSEAGNIIESDLTLDKAKSLLLEFEESDKKEGIFVKDFYEIKIQKTEKNPKGAGRKSIGASHLVKMSFDQETVDLLSTVENRSLYIRNLIKKDNGSNI